MNLNFSFESNDLSIDTQIKQTDEGFSADFSEKDTGVDFKSDGNESLIPAQLSQLVQRVSAEFGESIIVIGEKTENPTTVIIKQVDEGVQITVTDNNGSQSEIIRNGKDGVDGIPGKDGVDGKPGADGYTPVKGKDYFDGEPGADGKDGQPGADGEAGYTPVKGVDYFDGQDGKDGQPGKDGENGQDGVSCTHEWDGTVLSITSASGTTSADLKGEPGKDGADGYTPQKGVDYWTDTDKQEIAEEVKEQIAISAIPLTVETNTAGTDDCVFAVKYGNVVEATLLLTTPTTGNVLDAVTFPYKPIHITRNFLANTSGGLCRIILRETGVLELYPVTQGRSKYYGQIVYVTDE